MEEHYLIPANSKKSQLILGFFTVVDLFIFAIGLIYSIALLIIVQTTKIQIMLLIILPALISTFLVLPVPYYHNVNQLITNVIQFFTKTRRYYWKGWCASSEEENSK